MTKFLKIFTNGCVVYINSEKIIKIIFSSDNINESSIEIFIDCDNADDSRIDAFSNDPIKKSQNIEQLKSFLGIQ
jgi:hypothetical protein